MAIPGWPEEEGEAVAEPQPFAIRDDPGISSAARSSVRRAKGSESSALWAAVALVGVAVAGYAIVKAGRPEPVPAAPVVAAPQPEPEPEPAPRPRRARPAPKAQTTAPAPVAAKSKTVVHVEPEKQFKVVDPREGFETGEAFDNPPSPGRYGQRTSGLLERNNPAPRPNAPDPSFGRDP